MPEKTETAPEVASIPETAVSYASVPRTAETAYLEKTLATANVCYCD